MKYQFAIEVRVSPGGCYDYKRYVSSTITMDLPEGIVPSVATAVDQMVALAAAQAYVQGAEWLKEQEEKEKEKEKE